MSPCFNALRVHQWVKNTLVFLPMFAAHQFSSNVWHQSTLAFFAFCLVASSVYILNDIIDLPSDRAHPRKRNRPFAAGHLSVAQGINMATALCIVGLLLSGWLGKYSFFSLLIYFFAAMGYSLYFKRQYIIDICILAVLYTLRIVSGGVATQIPLSEWLIAFSLFFFLSLSAVKRQAELVDSKSREQPKAEGRGYLVLHLPWIERIAAVSGGACIVVLALYVNSNTVSVLYQHPMLLLGVCPVLAYWIGYMISATRQGKMLDDPIVFATKDTRSQICLSLIFLIAIGATYL